MDQTTPATGMSRRTLLRGAGGLGAGAVLGRGMLGGAALATTREKLREPDIIRSRHGKLRTTLTVKYADIMVAGKPQRMVTYNGQFPGPTLVANPGDTLDIKLKNEIDESTNIHTHGLHVSGEGNADNVSIDCAPGTTFDYDIPMRRDHFKGTNWYHPHKHGVSANQMFRGLVGALLIEDRQDELIRRRGISRDRVMVITAHEFDENGVMLPALASSQGRQFPLVNGQVDPVIDIAEGEVQRWRLVNASVNSVLRLRLQGHSMLVIGSDGNRHAVPVETEELVLAAAQRRDILVRGGPPGEFSLDVLPFEIGFGVFVPENRLATLVSHPSRTGRRRRGHGRRRGLCNGHWDNGWDRYQGLNLHPLLPKFTDLRKGRIDNRREVALTMTGGFGIDGKPFDHMRVDQWVELGEVEEWTVHNDTPLVHPFHIHVNPYLVTHRDGVAVDSPGYEDTTLVPNQGGSVTFLTHFEDFIGTAMFHCHFVTHSELGMMAIAEIEDNERGHGHGHGNGHGHGHGNGRGRRRR